MKTKHHDNLFIQLGVLVLFAIPGYLNAQESDAELLIAIVDAIEKGWEQGDGA